MVLHLAGICQRSKDEAELQHHLHGGVWALQFCQHGRGRALLVKNKKEGKERRGEGSSRGSRRGQKPHKKLPRMFRILKKNDPRTRKIMYEKDKSTYIKL